MDYIICILSIINVMLFPFPFARFVCLPTIRISDLFLGGSVDSDHDSVVSLIGLQGHLFKGLHFLTTHFLYLAGENGFCLGSGVNAVGLLRERNKKSCQK